MSAAAARRRKQQQKRAAAPKPGESADPVQLRLDSLLDDPTLVEESVAYEALQLAQSSVRRNVKNGNFSGAVEVAYTTSVALLSKSGRVSVSSQLLAGLVQVLVETHTACTEEWVGRFRELDAAYLAALDADAKMDPAERGRLQRLHLHFLRKGLKWSNDLGTVKHGALGMHALLGQHCWRMSCDEAVVQAEPAAQHGEDDDEDDEDEMETSRVGLRNESVTHYALAEKVDVILEKLKSLPAPTEEEMKMGHTCPPAQRDALLTRSILVLLAIENLRDATILASSYLKDVETRPVDEIKKSYLDKTDGKAPSHIMFVCMLLRICEKDSKTAPLFTWLVRNFGAELGTMHQPEIIKTYTTKIGRVYFDIQPPPSMMDMMENMMSMMGGGGMGGMGGAPGGMNPAMMQAAMAAMQGGGM
mmetsp:Transcript_14351/g.30130  ORF Transcript_14351/g.30130 Transcript_14351/m.30130 type:complete len:417 (+) Transcript_14351:111-1361(+)|eukprot:CAMPEP_0171333154 /NCGR_PEP_ID=MMETSP0878-20121228/3843_1 /TAXON_ID=67004 /ORGANISM="Thalassiosira weissflogii, Strain CCMP1336" /LENGTH=416 /DNA_ID=CAMNT_0011834061 /DNA_START=53 /DNA_END=1303 /DNA_ORIENTATION=-